jgi:hypothetical protein
MNHDWPPEVHKAMIAVDHVTPESPDLSLITPRPSPQRGSSHRVLAVAVVVVVAVVGGLAYVISRDDRDATSPSDTIAEPPSPTSAPTDSACSLLGDTGLSGAAATSVIDHLLISNPGALETAALRQCKDATADELRRLQAMVLERRAALNTSTTAEPGAEPTWQQQLAGERVQVTATPDPASTDELPSLQIDAGAVNGITVGSAVINDKGLVGRVQRVDDRTSTVELVTSTTFQADVRPAAGSASDACAGVVAGSGTGKPPFISVLNAGGVTAAPAGDLVVTADVSHLLPADIPVGAITSFAPSSDGGRCTIEWLAGSGDLTHLTVVLTVPPPLDGVPAGSVLRFEVPLTGVGDGATARVYDTADGTQVCTVVTSSTSSSGGCEDSSDIEEGGSYTFLGGQQGLGVLFGLTTPEIELTVTVGDATVLPDEHGFWYTTVPDGVTEFTLTSTRGRQVIPIASAGATAPESTVAISPSP